MYFYKLKSFHMKRIFLIIVSTLLLTGCGDPKKNSKSNENTTTEEVVEVKEESLVKTLDYKKFIKNIWNIEKYPDTFAYQSKLPCVIDFYADWCGPCRKIAPIMEELAKEYEGRLTVYKVNTDTEPKLSTIFEIKNIPTVFFLPMEGQPLMHVGALSKEEYTNIINQHLLK